MTELLTSAQMRAIERAAIESGEVTGLELMERAGRGVVEAIFAEWPELGAWLPRGRLTRRGGAANRPGFLRKKEAPRAVVLCGPGNNGGDGFVVARLLHARGWAVEVYLYGDPEKLPPDARVNYERWLELGEVLGSSELANHLTWPAFDADNPRFDIFVDAAFGTGLARAMPKDLGRIAAALNDREEPAKGEGWIISVDIPSGLCADSGRVIGKDADVVFFADLTVSFHARKLGHTLAHGPEASGNFRVIDIGLPEIGGYSGASAPVRPRPAPQGGGEIAPTLGPGANLVLEAQPAEAWWLSKDSGNHKYTHGHALILSGGPGKGGAARLAARGALRIGAGLVTVGCPPAALMENAARLDAVMLRSVKDAAAVAALLEDGRINAVGLGPGFGVGEGTRAMVWAVLKATRGGAQAGRGPGSGPGRGVVLDADALTSFADDPEGLFDMLHPACVLTPHGGEFARLFPDIAEKLEAPAERGPAYSKVDATREAAARAGCTVLFKGPDTVIADETGRASVNAAVYDRAAPWLATAGSGDVLAGFITGLMARGFGAMQAAETAAWLHVECARRFGPGLIAEDLPEMLPGVFAEMGL